MPTPTFTLTGTEQQIDGTPHVGSVLIVPNAVVRDAAGDVVLSGPVDRPLDATGHWSVDLPADDPSLDPATGLGYTIKYRLRAAARPDQTLAAKATGTTFDASDLVGPDVLNPITTAVGPKGDTGPQGIQGAPGDPTAYELRGTGSPEGVVTAAVGTYYTDTDVTAGALRWAKRSGAGSTGWVCVQGDTGWRDVSSTILNGWTAAGARVRRINNTVTWLIAGLTGTAATSVLAYPTPTGFEPSFGGLTGSLSFLLRPSSGTAPFVVSINGSGINAIVATSSTVNPSPIVTPTDAAWPSTLPGIAG